VEGYYQETGRAGRDGQPATAWLAYGLADVVQQRTMIADSEGDAAHKRRLGQHLDAMLALCETVECRRVQLLAYFGERSAACGNCDTCVVPAQSWDGTVPAQKLLSTVVRLKRERNQSFGALQIVDILLGRRTAKVEQFAHHELSTFGIGTELSEPEWRSVTRQLLARQLLAVGGPYHTLELTEGSAGVLTGERQVILRTDPERTATRRAARPAPAAADLPPAAAPLFERLRTWRAAVAKKQGVPAYVVFHDATLRAIATLAPDSLEALGMVSGIGENKLAKYGAGVLDVVAETPEAGDPKVAGL
jgi:ATP-dependent DNA helicase RecQ